MIFRLLTAVALSAALATVILSRTLPTDPCAPYVDVSRLNGHVVREYPPDLNAVCGGGIHNGGYAVIGVDRR